MSGRFNYSPQSDSVCQGYGEAMRPSASTSSHYTNDSGYSSRPTSSPIMNSPGDFENPGFNPEYNYQSYDSLSYQPAATPTSQSVATYSSSYDSTPRENRQGASSRPTPSSLGWDATQWAIRDFYDLKVPGKDSKSKEALLVLDRKYPAADRTPGIVYLDQSPKIDKHYHPCMYPGETCWKSGGRPVFGRSADLMRHYAHVHSRDQDEIRCDYNNCTRTTDPFTRKDHYRDHLRDFHKEDMPRPNKGRKSPNQQNWKDERRISSKWWRCPKCLERKSIKDHGWKCCGFECEEGRQKARIALDKIPETKSEQTYSMKMEVDTSVQPFPGCDFCQGGQVWNERTGFTPCASCSPSQVPVYGQYNTPSYASANASGSTSWDDTTAYSNSPSWDSRGRGSESWGYN